MPLTGMTVVLEIGGNCLSHETDEKLILNRTKPPTPISVSVPEINSVLTGLFKMNSSMHQKE